MNSSESSCDRVRDLLSMTRQLAPRRGGGPCCCYHQGTWHTVSRMASWLLQRADRGGGDHKELYCYFAEQAPRKELTAGSTERCSPWAAAAMRSNRRSSEPRRTSLQPTRTPQGLA